MVDENGFKGRSFMRPQQRDAILAELPQRGLMLEVGTGHGVTVAWWAKRRPNVQFLSVDTFTAAVGTGPGVIEDWLHNHGPNQMLFVGTSTEFSRFGYKQFDVVFIDGGHSYEDCWIDLRGADAFLLSVGKILVHDYGRTDVPQLRGVTRAVDDFCSESDWQVVRTVIHTAVLEQERCK